MFSSRRSSSRESKLKKCIRIGFNPTGHAGTQAPQRMHGAKVSDGAAPAEKSTAFVAAQTTASNGHNSRIRLPPAPAPSSVKSTDAPATSANSESAIPKGARTFKREPPPRTVTILRVNGIPCESAASAAATVAALKQTIPKSAAMFGGTTSIPATARIKRRSLPAARSPRGTEKN